MHRHLSDSNHLPTSLLFSPQCRFSVNLLCSMKKDVTYEEKCRNEITYIAFACPVLPVHCCPYILLLWVWRCYPYIPLCTFVLVYTNVYMQLTLYQSYLHWQKCLKKIENTVQSNNAKYYNLHMNLWKKTGHS